MQLQEMENEIKKNKSNHYWFWDNLFERICSQIIWFTIKNGVTASEYLIELTNLFEVKQIKSSMKFNGFSQD
jgi:hypothetical protein